MRILSGIQPSGTIHIGNYFGMIKPLLSFQDKSNVFCFIADYHSMTSLFDAKERVSNILESATTLLSCGLNPDKVTFFQQSMVPEVTELAWILSTVTPMGLLERCHSYKDKTAKGISSNHGLFAYPVLMAADILAYHSRLVPVGKDQIQHLEVARDIASKFNEKYGRILTMPEPYIQEQTAVVPGIDGQKMSKSYNNYIEVFGEEKAIRKKINSITMDSRPPGEPKPDADQNIAIGLLKLVVSNETSQDVETQLRDGKLGYGELKNILFESYNNYFAESRKLYQHYKNEPSLVRDLLHKGNTVAQEIAKNTITEIKRATGLYI